jgi:hypothetical protein
MKIADRLKRRLSLLGVISLLSLSLFGVLSITINSASEKQAQDHTDNLTDNVIISLNVTEPVDLDQISVTPTSQTINTTKVVTVTTKPEQTQIPTNTPSFTPIPTIAPTVAESPSAVVAFYADPQSDSDAEDNNHRTVVNNILARGANPVFNAGDIMEDGTQASLDRFNSVTNTLRSSRAFYSALGNNDRVEGDSSTPSALYLNNFSFPNNERWYSVNYGNLHMVILDSAFAASNPSQISWLINDLQSEASRSRITGVIFHHPSFASSISGYLLSNNVDFVIMGHTHVYSHYNSGGIEYFTCGGQPNMGYLIAKIYEERVELNVYSQGNSLVSTFNFNNR